MANTPTYYYPNAAPSTTPPTVAQNRGKSLVSGRIATDGATANVTIQHNLNLSQADLDRDFPLVRLEPRAATFYAQTIFVASKTANTVVLTTAGTVAITFGFSVERPPTNAR